jgi:cell division protein FtsQ
MLSLRLRRRRQNRRLDTASAGGGWLWFAGAFLAVGGVLATGYGLRWVLDPANLPLREVRIDGDFARLSPVELQKLLVGEATGGFFDVDVNGIRRVLLKNPWVRDVAVRRVWPDALDITVFEQRAIAAWNSDGLLNEEGGVFRPRPRTFPPGLVRLDGPEGAEAQVLDRYRQLSAWFRPLALTVDRVSLSGRRAWVFQLRDGPLVIAGRVDFEARVRRFIDTLPRPGGERLREAAVIDLRYTNGFAVRLRAPRTTSDPAQES